MEIAQRLGEIMDQLSGAPLSVPQAEELLEGLAGEGLVLRRCPRDSHMINVGMPVKKLLVLAAGECSVFSYSPEGRSVLVSRSAPPQYFGMLELLDGVATHTATVQAATDCLLLELPGATYLDCVQRDRRVMWRSLTYLAGFINRSLGQSEVRSLYPPRQRLLLYLCRACRNQALPVRLPVAKAQMAEELNINLRTLYRNLDRLLQEGSIGRERGKITINQSQLAAMKAQIQGFDPVPYTSHSEIYGDDVGGVL